MPLKHSSPNGNGPAKKFVKTWELIALTSWSKSTIYRYVEKGLLHPIQAIKGGSYLFPTDEVEALLGRSLFMA